MSRRPVFARHRFLACLAIVALAIAGSAGLPAAESSGDSSGDSKKGQTCGTKDNPRCGANEVCEIPAGNCDKPDVTGTCVGRPENCTQEYSPVCGCDGTTYSNDCMRLMAGARKSHNGECESTNSPQPGK